jgi:hypothetical protein
MSSGFDTGTGIAVAEVSGDGLPRAWPPVIPTDKLIGHGAAWVARGGVIVTMVDDLGLKFLIVGNIEETVDEKLVILVFALGKCDLGVTLILISECSDNLLP